MAMKTCNLVIAAILIVLVAAPPIWANQSTNEQVPKYLIESIVIRGNTKTKDYIIRKALLVTVGENLSIDDPRFKLSRFRVLSSGFFSDVRLTLEKGSKHGKVILVVEVVERGTIVLTDLFLGTSEATSAWGGLGIAENNFLGRGIGVEGAFVLGADPSVERGAIQQSYRLRAGARQIGGAPISASGSFIYLDGSDFFRKLGPDSSSQPDNFISIRYKRVGGTLGIGLDIARFTRLFWAYRGESIHSDAPVGAVRELPDGRTIPIDFDIKRGSSILSAMTIGLERDSRSDPILPQQGSLLSIHGTFSTGILGSSYDFIKIYSSYQHYFPLKWGHIFSLQLGGGVIFGWAPFFEKFFIGDFNDLMPGRALGLNFSTLPSRNFFGTSIDEKRYEELVFRTSVEYTVPWFRGGRFAYGGDFFLNIGLIALASRDDLRMRDRPLSQSVPVDLTLDAGLRLDTYIGIFRFSIGNGLGRIPF